MIKGLDKVEETKEDNYFNLVGRIIEGNMLREKEIVALLKDE